MKKIYPHIIGIGSAHAGLGLVSELLAEHPAIADSLPPRNFFNTETFTKRGYPWYEQLLASQSDGLLVGDCTPGYALHPQCAERIASAYPDAKLFMIVRHPLRRLLTEFAALQKIDKEAARSTPAGYLAAHPELQARSCYGAQLQQFFAYYSPLQLLVIVYEDLVTDPLKVMSELYDFYGVDKNFIPKRLRPYAPLPDEPKHRSLVSKLFKLIRSVYKKLTYREPAPVFPPEVAVGKLLSPDEVALFNRVYITDAKQLTTFMGRDIGVFWGLDGGESIDGEPDLAPK
jgi:hypothetical protein